jgi:hypothetical protein
VQKLAPLRSAFRGKSNRAKKTVAWKRWTEVEGDLPMHILSLGDADETGESFWATKRAREANKRRLRREQRMKTGGRPAKTEQDKEMATRVAADRARSVVRQVKNWDDLDDQNEEYETVLQKHTRTKRIATELYGADYVASKGERYWLRYTCKFHRDAENPSA